MEQEVAVNRILRDMNLQGLISSDVTGEVRSGEARFFLNALYVYAWERGTKYYGQSNSKPIIQFNKYGERLGEFKNQLEAAKEVGYTDRAILRSLKSGKPTRVGHIWIYKT